MGKISAYFLETQRQIDLTGVAEHRFLVVSAEKLGLIFREQSNEFGTKDLTQTVVFRVRVKWRRRSVGSEPNVDVRLGLCEPSKKKDD